MLVEGGLQARGGHGEIRAGERETGFRAETPHGELIPRVKGEDRDDGGWGGDGRVHEKVGNGNAAGLVGVFSCEIVRGNIAAKLPAETIIRGKLSEHTQNDLAALQRVEVWVSER